MTASLSSRTPQVLAVDILELDIQLVIAMEVNKLVGLQQHVWHGMISR